jgi:peptidoglycan-associated lipoprotein
MTKQFQSKILPVAGIIVLGLALAMTGCKKKMPKEAPPPPPPPAVEKVTAPAAPDTTGQAARDRQAAMDADKARIQTIYFDFDKSDIRADQRDKISTDAEILRKWTDWKIRVEGNCDERGTTEYNLALGERRANAGKQALVAAGIDAGRILTVSYGKDKPADPGHTESAWAKNRRDDFKAE